MSRNRGKSKSSRRRINAEHSHVTKHRSRLEVLEPRLLLSTYAVNTFSDELASGGTLSLREAVIASNARAGNDLIILQTGTYALTIGGRLENADSRTRKSPRPPSARNGAKP